MPEIKYYDNLRDMQDAFLKTDIENSLVLCQDYKQVSYIQKRLQQEYGLLNGQIMTYKDFMKVISASDYVQIEDIKRYLCLYESISIKLKEKYKLNDYFSSVEFLNNALNYFNDLKTACLSIDQLKEKLQDEAGIKDWQGEMMDDLAEIYDAYRTYLNQKSYTDPVFMTYDMLDFQMVKLCQQIIYFDLYDFEEIDRKIIQKLEAENIPVILYIQGNSELFDSEDMKIKAIEAEKLLSDNKPEIRLFQSKNVFGMQRQLLNQVSDKKISCLIDFDIRNQSFYQQLNPEYFEVNSAVELNHTAVYRFLDQMSMMLREITEDTDNGKKLIPIYYLFHWLMNPDVLQYMGCFDDQIIIRRMSRCFYNLNAEGWFYFDTEGEFTSALSQKDYYTPVADLISQALNVIKRFAEFSTINEIIEHLLNWQENHLNRLLYRHQPDTESQPEIKELLDSSDEFDVLLTALVNLKSISQLGIPENPDEIFNSVDAKLSFIVEFLRGKSYKVKQKASEEKRISIHDFEESSQVQGENIAVLNLQEGVLPSVRKTAFLLTEQQRKVLKLKTWDDIRALEKYCFYKLLNNNNTVSLFYYDNQDDNIQRSSFIEELRFLIPDLKPVLLDDIAYQDYFDSMITQKESLIQNDKSVLKNPEFYRIPFVNCDEAEDAHHTLRLNYYSWSGLYKNRFNWYLDFYRNFSVFKEIEKPYLSYQTLGNIVHTVIEKLIKQKVYKEIQDENKLVSEIRKRFDDELNNRYYYKSAHNFDGQFFKYFLKETLIRNIYRFLYSIFMTENCDTVYSEKDFNRLITLDDNLTVDLNGRVDLLIRNNEGFSLIDVKTGAGSKDQLDFYRYLWSAYKPDNWQCLIVKIFNMVKDFASNADKTDSEENLILKNAKLFDKIRETVQLLFKEGCYPSAKPDSYDQYSAVSRQDQFIQMVEEKKQS